MIVSVLVFVLSLSVLLFASDKFIESAEKIGLSFGISPFIIGVTIVACGTSIPELATAIASIFSGSSEIICGTIIGSNITNILLVLGLTAVVGKGIKLEFNIMDIDMPLLLGSSLLLYFALMDLEFTYFEAILFLVALAIFLFNSINENQSSENTTEKVNVKHYFILLLGGAFIWLGAEYVIKSIEEISGVLGINKDIIALTAVALGTSLPEVIVSLAAARKGKNAIAIGNVLGSNLFNTYAVMSIPRFFGEIKVTEDILDFGLPFMVGVTFMFAMVTFSKKISKWEGMLFVVFYALFIGQLVKNTLG